MRLEDSEPYVDTTTLRPKNTSPTLDHISPYRASILRPTNCEKRVIIKGDGQKISNQNLYECRDVLTVKALLLGTYSPQIGSTGEG